MNTGNTKPSEKRNQEFALLTLAQATAQGFAKQENGAFVATIGGKALKGSRVKVRTSTGEIVEDGLYL